MFFTKVDKAGERRAYKRVLVDDIDFRLDRRHCKVADISFDGMLVRGAPDWIVAGQLVHFSLAFPLHGRTLTVPGTGLVLRQDADGMALRYRTARSDWRAVLYAFFQERKAAVEPHLRDGPPTKAGRDR